jgi:hypothetical protein
VSLSSLSQQLLLNPTYSAGPEEGFLPRHLAIPALAIGGLQLLLRRRVAPSNFTPVAPETTES